MNSEDDPIEFEIADVPVTLEKMPEAEVQQRLFGGVKLGNFASSGIKGYNEYHIKHGQPWHCVTISRLKEMLLAWGVEENMADKLSMEVGYAK